MNVAEIVTKVILEKLEKGVVPWQKPWNAPLARNWKTRKVYRGINQLLLQSGEYATFKQVAEAGGRVKKGEKPSIVVFFKWLEKDDEEKNEEEAKRFPVLRYYKVFEISQCEGLESKEQFAPHEFDPIEAAERLVDGYVDKPEIRYGGARAFYRPGDDSVTLPDKWRFFREEEYYSTLFHELTHSTGHEKRLNRKGITDPVMHGSKTYGQEELVAEIGAASLCREAHIENTIDNSASYIDSWARAIRADSRMVILAAQQAQKAVDYILGSAVEADAE